MDKTRVFISSTFFDLSQVRDDIRRSIIGLGHEPVLSEFPSFPVLPELSIIENCRRNVRNNADVFILIVGGRKGSIDNTTKRTITNIEYETAKQSGIDTFIFVKRSVLSLLPIWEKNPTADFSSEVDSPDVFHLLRKLAQIKSGDTLLTRASEISDILSIQLSVFLKYLIDKKGRADYFQ